MKIAQINLQYNWGGAEKHTLLLARGLRDAGDEVRLCSHPNGGLQRHAIVAGIHTLAVTSFTQLDLSAAFRLAARLARFKPDILHLHTPKDYLCGSLAALILRPCRVVLTRHLLLPLKPLMRLLYSRADGVLCLSRGIYESLHQQGIPSERLHRARSAIDVGEFDISKARQRRNDLRRTWRVGADAVAVGLVGRMVPWKGHGCLLKAASRMIETGLNVQFVFAGDGPESGALEAQALQLGIKDRVHFLGHCENMPAVMAALDILVLASETELLPLTVMEGMASSLPVVATDVGGVPEIVQDRVTGVIVPPMNEAKMAEALTCLILNPGMRIAMGRAGRLLVEQEFDLPCMIADAKRVYKSLLCDRGMRCK